MASAGGSRLQRKSAQLRAVTDSQLTVTWWKSHLPTDFTHKVTKTGGEAGNKTQRWNSGISVTAVLKCSYSNVCVLKYLNLLIFIRMHISTNTISDYRWSVLFCFHTLDLCDLCQISNEHLPQKRVQLDPTHEPSGAWACGVTGGQDCIIVPCQSFNKRPIVRYSIVPLSRVLQTKRQKCRLPCAPEGYCYSAFMAWMHRNEETQQVGEWAVILEWKIFILRPYILQTVFEPDILVV